MSASNDTVFIFLRQGKATSLHLRGAERDGSCWPGNSAIHRKQGADLLHLVLLGTRKTRCNRSAPCLRWIAEFPGQQERKGMALVGEEIPRSTANNTLIC